jgi:hypothetical protein
VHPARKWSVAKGRHPQSGAHPPGEGVAQEDDRVVGVEVVAREQAGGVGHERHHIEHALARMGALVRAEIETGDARPGQRPDRVGYGFCLAGQGEDRSVVVGVAVEIEEDGAGRVGETGEKVLVTAVADVDDALDGHGASLPLRVGGGQCPRVL